MGKWAPESQVLGLEEVGLASLRMVKYHMSKAQLLKESVRIEGAAHE